MISCANRLLGSCSPSRDGVRDHCRMKSTLLSPAHALRLRACGAALLALLLAPAGCHQGESPSASRSPGRYEHGNAGNDVIAWVLQARSTQVQDGDSFVARTADGSQRTIRLSGIDAPERTQAHADQARQNLRGLLDGHELSVHVAKTDQYGRAIAQVFIEGDSKRLDVGLAQIEAGMAWFFRRYQDDLPVAARERYADAERAARNAAKGFWQATDPEPPWDFRRRQRSGDARSAR